MKPKNDYPKKFLAEGVAFEQDSTGDNTPITVDQEVPLPSEAIEAAEDAEEKSAAIPSNLTDGQIREQLKRMLSLRGLREPHQELVLAVALDKKTASTELSAATVRSESWVYNELKKPTIRQAITDVKSGTAGRSLRAVWAQPDTKPKSTGGKAGLIVMPAHNLTECMERLLQALRDFRTFVKSDAHFIDQAVADLGCPSSMTAQEKRLAATFHCFPSLLSNEGFKGAVVSDLEGLLTMALYGNSQEVKKARTTLLFLTRPRRGNPRPWPSSLLTKWLFHICECLHALRQVWEANRQAGLPKDVRSREIRQGIGAEESRFSDTELQTLMGGDLVKAAARVAEKATESTVTAEVFERAAKKDAAFQEKLKAF